MRGQRGFTLLEVVIALAIMGISLTVLLQSQAASLHNASRSRDMTVATLLARGKMIDIEKHLFHDGFSMSTEDEEGDFNEEGHGDVKWHYRISEVEFDISALMSVCTGLSKGDLSKEGKSDNAEAGNDCESVMGGLGASIGGFTEELGRSLRAVELTVSWPEGKYSQSMSVRAMLSRDDFNTEQESQMQKLYDDAQQTPNAAGVPGGTGTGTGTAPPVPGGALP